MPSNSLSYQQWLELTAAIGRRRSTALKAVDDALQRFEQFGGGDARWRLEQALQEWKSGQGPGDAWKRSVRNRRLAVEQLTAMLAGGDSEAAWGRVPDFMHHTFEHARLGVLYLLGRLQTRPDIFNVVLEGGVAITGSVLSYQGAARTEGGLGRQDVSLAQDWFNTANVPGSAILNAAGTAGADTWSPEAQTLRQRLGTMLHEFAQKTLKALAEKFGSIDVTVAAVKNLINLCCKLFLSTVGAGLVSGGMDTLKGVVNVADAAITRIRTWLNGRSVLLSAGHPTVVVEAIRGAMNLSLMQGLWQTLKGAGNLGLAFASAGAALVVGVITAILELLVKLIWRLVEVSCMRRVFAQAAGHYANKDGKDALHKRPFAFHHWYRSAALNLPAIAVLTLNSGICGDKMVYLSMYQKDGGTVGSDEFRRGAQFLDGLKPWGVAYLDKCGFAFHSGDPFVGKLLGFARSHQAQRSAGGKAWDTVVKIANA